MGFNRGDAVLIRRPSDILPSEITPREVYFNRRQWMAGAAGLVRADVAVDLRNGLNELRERISQGQVADLRRRAADLRT